MKDKYKKVIAGDLTVAYLTQDSAQNRRIVGISYNTTTQTKGVYGKAESLFISIDKQTESPFLRDFGRKETLPQLMRFDVVVTPSMIRQLAKSGDSCILWTSYGSNLDNRNYTKPDDLAFKTDIPRLRVSGDKVIAFYDNPNSVSWDLAIPRSLKGSQ